MQIKILEVGCVIEEEKREHVEPFAVQKDT